MNIKEKITHINVHYFTLVILAISLPVSPFVTSLSQFILIINWLVDRNYHQKWANLKQNLPLLLIISVFLIHVLGLAYTQDFAYAFHDLKIKLPILILPLVIGSYQPLSKGQFMNLLHLFVLTVFVATLISFAVYLGVGNVPFDDIRGISIFISHIRFSLYIVLSMAILVKWLFINIDDKQLMFKPFYLFLLVWFMMFLLLIQSLTGIFILAFLFIYLIFYVYQQRLGKRYFYLFIAIVAIGFGIFFMMAFSSIKSFMDAEKPTLEELPKYTAQGNPYQHDLSLNDIENGHFVWIYVNYNELRKEWNERSVYPFDSLDAKGQGIQYTIIRYLTSKGLTKDSLGVHQLSEVDIKNIEQGMANHIFEKGLNIHSRIYQTIWEIYNYMHGWNPERHSVTQRIEFLRVAFHIFKQYPIIGTGTGDLLLEYQKAYQKSDTQLEYARWKRAHNQYATFLITFGVIGFAWIMFALFYPLYIYRKQMSFYLAIFAIILFMSMLNEDTLETQAGATLFAFFYSMFLHHNKILFKK